MITQVVFKPAGAAKRYVAFRPCLPPITWVSATNAASRFEQLIEKAFTAASTVAAANVFTS